MATSSDNPGTRSEKSYVRGIDWASGPDRSVVVSVRHAAREACPAFEAAQHAARVDAGYRESESFLVYDEVSPVDGELLLRIQQILQRDIYRSAGLGDAVATSWFDAGAPALDLVQVDGIWQRR